MTKHSSLDSQLITLVFKYIFATNPYILSFFKAASENTLVLAIIEGFGQSFYRNAISSVLL